MKIFVVVFVTCFVFCLSTAVGLPAQSKYTSKYDNINVDEILKNERLLKNYMDCVMGRGKCTKEGLELKKRIPEAIETDCAKCTDQQKKLAGKIMAHLLQYRKDYWNELLAKYDPEGKFRKKYEVED